MTLESLCSGILVSKVLLDLILFYCILEKAPSETCFKKKRGKVAPVVILCGASPNSVLLSQLMADLLGRFLHLGKSCSGSEFAGLKA